MNEKFYLILLTSILCTIGFVNTEISYRLSKFIKPEAYNLTIEPFLLSTDGEKQFTFNGEVNITIVTYQSNNSEITLHKDLLNISTINLYDRTNKLIQAIGDSEQTYESVTDKLTLKLKSNLNVGERYVLQFIYKGEIRDGLAGFFRGSYNDSDGNVKWIGITQMQRLNARTVFPCFDEPGFKATFRLSLTRPREYVSIFNTKLLETTLHSDGIHYIDHFDKTPPMSTYLVAFLVSDLKSRGNSNLSVIALPEYYNKTKFSHEVSVKALNAFDNYTRLPYNELGNPILQHAGSPIFPHNGMENWGLIIYKDAVLIHEPNYTDGWFNKEYTLRIIVHETSHMWFGDSVTFAWWSYFWLNEAFARYFEYFMSNEIYPEYQLDQQFVIKQIHMIFSTDAVNSTQPMTSSEASVATPSQIANKFSSIAYAKGASIVRMIRNLMGSTNFDNRLYYYLVVNQQSNTVPSDLFFQMKVDWPENQFVDLDQFFYDWTEQVGYPILYVELDDDEVKLKQKRFLLNDEDGSDSSLRYTIPITYTTDDERNFSNLTPKFYLNKTIESYSLQFNEKMNWIIFNIQQSNYYRVYYDHKILNNIKKALLQPAFSDIHVINRAQLVDDLFNYGRIGLLKYSEIFSFIEYLEYEDEYLPWYAAFSGLQLISQRLTIKQQPNFGKFLFNITDKVYKKLGFYNSNDTILDIYNRNLVISWLCKYDNTNCNKGANSTFHQAIETDVMISPDFRETIYCTASRYDMRIATTLWNWFNLTNLTSEKELLLRTMGCVNGMIEIQYTLILSDLIPQEMKRIALTPLYTQNQKNIVPLFNMIDVTIERLAVALGSWSVTANVISDMANYFTTDDEKSMLESFIDRNGQLFGNSITTLNNAVKTVDNNLEWAEENLKSLLEYLNERYNGAQSNIFSIFLLLLSFVTYLF